MHVAETVFVGSIPGFLTASDLLELNDALREVYAEQKVGALTAARRTESVHSIDGMSIRDAMEVYEPHGRDEVPQLNDAAQDILRRAADRHLPALRVTLPSAGRMSYWTFVSYTENQYITPHIDLSNNDSDPAHAKVAGISICLSEPDEYGGGEFYVETTCDAGQWLTTPEGGLPTVRPDCDESSERYRKQARTRWVARPGAGDALLYGSQQTHGTRPVSWGRVNKIIGFLVS